jgi:uncharacterized membrane protein
LSEGCQYPLILCQRVFIALQSSWQRVLGNPQRYLQEGCPINKEEGNLFAIPVKNLKVKIKINGATYGFENYQRFIF